MAAIPQHIWAIGLISTSGMGLLSGGVYASLSKEVSIALDNEVTKQVNPSFAPPMELRVRSDYQSYDPEKERFVAEGNAEAFISGYILKADRIEFDNASQTLYALGSVHFKKGNQYLQASYLRYQLDDKSGELQDVYGVVTLNNLLEDLNSDLENKEIIFDKNSRGNSNGNVDKRIKIANNNKKKPDRDFESDDSYNTFIENQFPASVKVLKGNQKNLEISCPPSILPIPNWHPNPWAITFWGGQMTDAKFGETFLFDGLFREEYLLGLGLHKRIYRNGPFAIELETDFFRHIANEQVGGRFNQDIPNSTTSGQKFGEIVLGIAARVWVRPWLSFALIEGVSYNTDFSNYERTYRDKYAKLLNYLGLELEAELSERLSLIGRIHHRSGAYGIYSGVKEGSNAYLLGLRYHWGQDSNFYKQKSLKPPLGCPNSKSKYKNNLFGIHEELKSLKANNAIKEELDDENQISSLGKAEISFQDHPDHFSKGKDNLNRMKPFQQELIREESISKSNQQIRKIKLRDKFIFQGQFGIPSRQKGIQGNNAFSAMGISRLNKKLITGSIRKWRIQADRVFINSDGWTADFVSFTNDPLTPAQSRLDAEDVIAIEESNGDILIRSKRSKLILEDRFSFPFRRKQRIKRKQELVNRWIIGIDNKDRDGLFIGRQFRPWRLGKSYEVYFQPQLMLQRMLNGTTNSYIAEGKPSNSEKVSTATTLADFFGMKVELKGKILDWNLNTQADLSTLNNERISNGSRLWSTLSNSFDLPWINDIGINLFGTFRYRTWNGSLGNTEIYSAYGGFLEKKSGFKISTINNNFIVRLGLGRYRAEESENKEISFLWRGNIYAELNSSYPIWRGNKSNLGIYSDYKYSPEPIIPGLTFNTKFSTAFSAYEGGEVQNTISFSAGPALTLGNFARQYFDYTKLRVFVGGTIKQGDSPFSFDKAVDLGRMSVSLSQQIAGPLVFDTGFEFNIDKGSEYYGQAINSSFGLRWQRRSYDLGLFYKPKEGVGGMTIRFNDFNYNGKGLPFIQER